MKLTAELASSSLLRFCVRLARRTGIAMSAVGLCVTFAYGESDVRIENIISSPRGTFRIEREGKRDNKGNWATTFWIIPAADPSQRVRLDETFNEPDDWHFFISPDEQWICTTVHEHSQLQSLRLYQRKTGLQFDRVATMEEEKEGDGWNFDKNDRFAPKGGQEAYETGRVYNHFIAWSSDSARLLVERRSQLEAKKDGEYLWRRDYFYFNLGRGKLEHTQYLSTLNRAFRRYDSEQKKDVAVPSFAEPPSEGSTRFTRRTSPKPTMRYRIRTRSGTVFDISNYGSRRANPAPSLSPPWDRKRNARAENCYISLMLPKTVRMSWRTIWQNARVTRRRTKKQAAKANELRMGCPWQARRCMLSMRHFRKRDALEKKQD